MQLPSESFFGVNRAVWLRNPILMRSFIISHFCLCALSEKKLFCLLSPFQKYNGKPTRTAEVHICPPTPLSLFLCFSYSFICSFRLEASSICFDPHLLLFFFSLSRVNTNSNNQNNWHLPDALKDICLLFKVSRDFS